MSKIMRQLEAEARASREKAAKPKPEPEQSSDWTLEQGGWGFKTEDYVGGYCMVHGYTFDGWPCPHCSAAAPEELRT